MSVHGHNGPDLWLSPIPARTLAILTLGRTEPRAFFAVKFVASCEF